MTLPFTAGANWAEWVTPGNEWAVPLSSNIALYLVQSTAGTLNELPVRVGFQRMTETRQEWLARMRSVGYMPRGRTRYTSAGTEVVSVHEEKTTNDFIQLYPRLITTEAVLTEHRDGRKDAALKPKPVAMQMESM